MSYLFQGNPAVCKLHWHQRWTIHHHRRFPTSCSGRPPHDLYLVLFHQPAWCHQYCKLQERLGELIIFIPGLFLRVRFSKPSDGSRFPSMLQSYVLSSNLTSGIYLSIVFLLYFFKLFTKYEVVAVCIIHLRVMHLTPASSPWPAAQ